jgi:hypothetical protein
MSITKKYNFRVTINQFHHPVSEDYEDPTEISLINLFEKYVLQFKEQKREKYNMIELGSNQCYYSLLFKHILGKYKTTNIMVEPDLKHLEAGKGQFKLNNCEGIFYNRGIGNRWAVLDKTFSVEPITLEDILTENKLQSIDVIHSDIDGSEVILLESNKEFFVSGKAKIIFLLTHSNSLHEQCKDFFTHTPYTLINEIREDVVGWDRLLVYALIKQ